MSLRPQEEHTRRLHLAFALLEGAALGILANAPVVAMRSLGSPSWQLALALVPSSLGIFIDLYLGARMAERSKVPYIQGAMGIFALAMLGMTATGDSLIFNALNGLGLLGQIVAQMALTSVVRAAYPASVRGAITGRIRRWTSLAIFGAALGSALLLDQATGTGLELPCARGLLGVAALASLLAALVIGRVQITGASDAPREPPRGEVSGALQHAWRILRGDDRFRLYLGTSLVAALGSLMTAPYVNAFLVKDIKLGYLATLAVAQLLPQLFAFATTERWGRYADGQNLWWVWTWIRGVWGASFVLLGVAAAIAPYAPAASLGLAVVSKISYGCVMGGSWILYWQVGVAHFARPGADTSRYMSLMTAVSGGARLIGPSLGALLVLLTQALAAVFLIGGATTFLSSLLCHLGYRRERDDPRYHTIASFEASLKPPSSPGERP